MLEMEMQFKKLEGKEKFRTLPKIIDRHQHRYVQLYRKGRLAIYEKTYRPYAGYNSVGSSYEVIIIRLVRGDASIGTVHREAFPSDIDWGKKGWSFFTYERATVKIGELLMRGRFTSASDN